MGIESGKAGDQKSIKGSLCEVTKILHGMSALLVAVSMLIPSYSLASKLTSASLNLVRPDELTVSGRTIYRTTRSGKLKLEDGSYQIGPGAVVKISGGVLQTFYCSHECSRWMELRVHREKKLSEKEYCRVSYQVYQMSGKQVFERKLKPKEELDTSGFPYRIQFLEQLTNISELRKITVHLKSSIVGEFVKTPVILQPGQGIFYFEKRPHVNKIVCGDRITDGTQIDTVVLEDAVELLRMYINK